MRSLTGTALYTSFRFADRLPDNGILPSMGSVDDSCAAMKNFWPALKVELVYRQAWRTRDEAENALFAYTDGWYGTASGNRRSGRRSERLDRSLPR
jgi:putative transposase